MLPQIVKKDNGQRAVSAIALHKGLGYNKAHYAKWARVNIVNAKWAFENEDWVEVRTKGEKPQTGSHPKGENPQTGSRQHDENPLPASKGGRPTTDYLLSLSFAKRLAMMARTEAGETIRRYFSEVESRPVVKEVEKPTPTIEIIDYKSMQVISARALHTALGIQREIKDWLKSVFSIGYINDVDYMEVCRAGSDRLPLADYYLTLDMAKEICMFQRSEVGRTLRSYIIGARQNRIAARLALMGNNPLLLPARQTVLQLFEKSETHYMTSTDAIRYCGDGLSRYHITVALGEFFGKSKCVRLGDKVKRVYQIKPIV
jgi:anti-repressor protein